MSETFVEKIIGGRITDITRVCDLVSLRVFLPSKKVVYIHIQTFFRVLWKDGLIISSEDMYRCAEWGDKEHFKWDVPGNSIFDDSIKKHLDIIKKSHIIGVTKQTAGDLIIFLEDDLSLQLLVNTVESEEKYRIFDNTGSLVFNS